MYIFGVEIGSRTPKGHEIPTQDRVILPIIHIFFVKKIENERTYTLIGSVDFEIGHFHRILTAWYGASFGVSNKLQGVFKDLGKDLLVCFLQKGSWYTNGHYVAFVSPPWEYGNVVPASHSVEKNMRSFSGIFKLGTAELVDLKVFSFFVEIQRKKREKEKERKQKKSILFFFFKLLNQNFSRFWKFLILVPISLKRQRRSNS